MRQWEDEPLDDAIEAGVRAFAAAFKDDEPRRYLAPIRARLGKPRGQ